MVVVNLFVVNYECFNNTFTCNKIVSNYLIKHKIPLLSTKDKGVFIFSDTNELQEVIKNAPFWIKRMALI
jgi:hypothetical protein